MPREERGRAERKSSGEEILEVKIMTPNLDKNILQTPQGDLGKRDLEKRQAGEWRRLLHRSSFPLSDIFMDKAVKVWVLQPNVIDLTRKRN